MGGYCFLNNAAVAVQTLLDQGAKRVVVLDVDYHHGNGIAEHLLPARRCAFHQHPWRPADRISFYLGHADEQQGGGAGLGFNLNLPLPAGSSVAKWFAALMRPAFAFLNMLPMPWWCRWGWTPMWVIPSRNLR